MASIDTSSLIACTINGTAVDLKSFSVADDSLQQNGLVKCRGKIVVVGIAVPPVNAVVRISGQDKSLYNYAIPRTFRVLSSFANVFTGLTDIELGCKLTYLSDRRPPNKNPTSKEENSDIPEAVFTRANIPISASYVFQQCLTAIGVTASSNPLQSKFAILEFDLSQGYVETMAKLLESESYAGCLDDDEILQIKSLDVTGGVGPVITREMLLSVGPIGSGALPGEDVVVSYSSRKLKLPTSDEDEALKRNYEKWQSTGPGVQVLDYELDEDGNQVDFIFEYTEYLFGYAEYDKEDRLIKKLEEQSDENGFTYTDSYYSYYENGPYTEVTEKVSVEGPATKVFDGCNFAVEEFPTRASRPRYIITLQLTKTKTTNNSLTGFSRVSTTQEIPYIFTPMGKRVIGRLAPEATGGRIDELLGWAQTLVNYGSKEESKQGRDYNIKKRPSQEQRNDDATRKDGSVESLSRFSWVYGDIESTAVTEFSIPYAPDDILGWTEVGGYTVAPSNVVNVVLRYGRTQNKLLLGNRQGMNIVVAPKSLPKMPFDVFYINLFGFTIEYRLNRMAWTGTAEQGIVATCDAVLWGAVGITTGTLISQAWTPLPPDALSLPVLPTYSPGDPPAQNVIQPPVPGSPYEDYPLILDSSYSLPIYSETVYSGGIIRLKGKYRENIYPVVVRLTPGLFEIDPADIRAVGKIVLPLPAGQFEIADNIISAAEGGPSPELELDFEGTDGSTTIIDSSPFARSLTAYGSAEIDTAEFSTGASSLYCEGDGGFPPSGYVEVPADAVFDLSASGSFQIEFSYKIGASGGGPTYFIVMSNSSLSESIYIEDTSGTMRLVVSVAGGAPIYQTITAPILTWHDVVIAYDGTTLTAELNGTGVFSTTIDFYFPWEFSGTGITKIGSVFGSAADYWWLDRVIFDALP